MRLRKYTICRSERSKVKNQVIVPHHVCTQSYSFDALYLCCLTICRPMDKDHHQKQICVNVCPIEAVDHDK